jgi:hypothetical protein
MVEQSMSKKWMEEVQEKVANCWEWHSPAMQVGFRFAKPEQAASSNRSLFLVRPTASPDKPMQVRTSSQRQDIPGTIEASYALVTPEEVAHAHPLVRDAGWCLVRVVRDGRGAAPAQRRADPDRQPWSLDIGLLRQPGHPHTAHRPPGS